MNVPHEGIVPLRPLAVRDVLAGAIGYVRTNPLSTLGVAAVVTAVAQVLELVVDLALPPPGLAELATGRADGLAARVLAQVLSGVATVVLTALLTSLLLVVLGRAVRGQRIRPGAAWRAAAPRLPGLVGLTLLIGVIVGAVLLVAVLPALVAAATGTGGAIVLAFVLVAAGVVVVVHLSVLWALAPAAYVLEPVGVLAALARSRELVRGAWGRTFGVLVLVVLVLAVPAAVVMALSGSLAIGPAPTVGASVRATVGLVAVGVFTAPFGTGVLGLLYVDRRIRRERFDVELTAAADPSAPR